MRAANVDDKDFLTAYCCGRDLLFSNTSIYAVRKCTTKHAKSVSLKPQRISHGNVCSVCAYALIACGPPSRVCKFPSMCIRRNDANTNPVIAIRNFLSTDDRIDFFMFTMIVRS